MRTLLLSLLMITGLLAPAAIAEDQEKVTADLWIDAIEAVDPLLYAILRDHMDEARRIDSLLQAADDNAVREAMAEVRWKFSNRAFSRASDAAAIEVIKKSNAIVDVLSKQYPEGCQEFLLENLSVKAASILDRNKTIADYLEALRRAYDDGKNREPIARMDVGTMFVVVTEDLGVSQAEIQMLTQHETTPAAQLCSIMRKSLNIEAVRASQRGQYARANIFSKSVQ